ncbi:type II toxin-antitoxin system VapC family toxin [Candidatus Bathyarchaeota archaeon]|nr:MAG: type II toxin-antitoxin system VapC family toxin [Candidatus Bathyarchaeota archaeon]
MKAPPTVDTRFLLTNFLAEPSPLREKTRQKAAELEAKGAFVPTIVLHEVYKFEYETVGADAAMVRVNSIVRSNFQIIDLDTKIALSAARLRCRHKDLPTADSIIAATAIELKSNTVFTDDPHFQKIPEINVEWI